MNVDLSNPVAGPIGHLVDLNVGGFVRMPIILNKGKTLSDYATYVSQIHQARPGVQVIGTIGTLSLLDGNGNPLNPPLGPVSSYCDPNSPPAQCGSFSSWVTQFFSGVTPVVTAIANHAPGFDWVEVLNEPDLGYNGSFFPSHGGSSVHPAAYATILNDFYTMYAPLLEPRVKIIMGGMVSGHREYVNAMGGVSSDCMNIHSYLRWPGASLLNNAPAGWCNYSVNGSIGSVANCQGSIESVWNAYPAYGSSCKILTEWGYSDDQNPLVQADLVSAFFQDPVTSGYQAAMFGYSDAQKPNYGVVDQWGNPKSSYLAFQNPTGASSGIPLNRWISIRANANGQYVCADLNRMNPPELIANRGAVGPWEKFYVQDMGGGNVALRAMANSDWVCADLQRQSSNPNLIANRTAASTWETYKWIDLGNQDFALVSQANGLYVCAENAGSSPLNASRSARGAWETFHWDPQ
jgi:hypothetical protein